MRIMMWVGNEFLMTGLARWPNIGLGWASKIAAPMNIRPGPVQLDFTLARCEPGLTR